MALTWTQVGTLPDGSPHFTVESDSPEPHFVITGQRATGTVRTPDGTSYDVTPPVIEAQTEEHAGHLDHLIGEHLEASSDPATEGFAHTCTDHCGSLKRETV